MNENTRKILAGGAVSLVLVPVINYHEHDDIVEPDYTQKNTTQVVASGYSDTTSITSTSSSSSTLSTTSSTTINGQKG